MEFHELVFPIIENIRDSYLEINKLSKLRDTLLPKLMSGEIDVSEINCDFIYFIFTIINYFNQYIKILKKQLAMKLDYIKTRLIKRLGK